MANEDRVRIPIDDNSPGPDASKPCDVGKGSFTLELWIRGKLADNATANAGGDKSSADESWRLGNVLLDRAVMSESGRTWGVSVAGGFVRFGTGAGDGAGKPNTIEGSVNVLDDAWHHVAVVRDAETGVKRIVVDGVEDFASAPGASTADLSYPDGGIAGARIECCPVLVIGASKSALASFHGTVDELRVWRVTRTAAQIAASAKEVLPPSTLGLAASYRFEEGSGTSVGDSSSAGSPPGNLSAGQSGNGEWVAYADDPGNTAPMVTLAVPPGFEQNVVATGLVEPTTLEFAPDGRLFVAERGGRIRVVQNGQLVAQPLIQIDADIEGGERGLVGLAVHPQFASNGWLYAYYTTHEPRNRVSRFTVAGNVASPSSEVVIWQNPAIAADYHHGGCIRFAPDGNLLIATGDQFNAANAQDLTVQHGKLLRLRPDGSVPSNNPFLGVPGAQAPIAALGLRNPFRMIVDAANGRVWIGDVGGNTIDSWEELNLFALGANFGWPNQQGNTCVLGNCAGYSKPRYTYSHSDPNYFVGMSQAAIIAGAIYDKPQFPAEYQGNLFVGDYANRWIRRLVLDAAGSVIADPIFIAAPNAGTVVDLKVGPDGALYYATLGIPWSGSPDVAEVRRVAWIGTGNEPPVAVANASPKVGAPPLAVQFSSAGTNDPDSGPSPLAYFWTFGDGATSTLPNPSHVYAASGSFTAQLTVSDGAGTAAAPPIAISVGGPPTARILLPLAGTKYKAGDVIAFKGFGDDPEQGVLPAASNVWQVVLVHDTHTHPFYGPIYGVSQGSFAIPLDGHPPEDTHYEVQLTVADDSGLSNSAAVALTPIPSTLVLDSVPSGLPLIVDGVPRTTPAVIGSLAGFQHHVEAPTISDQSAQSFDFYGWTDGGPNPRVISAPAGGFNVTANYSMHQMLIAKTSVPSPNRNAEHYPPVGQEYGNVNDAQQICTGRDAGGVHQAGIEFPLDVPQGATIAGASLTVVASGDQAGDPVAIVRAYDVPNATPFDSSSNRPLTLWGPLTESFETWTFPPFVPGGVYDSPDLAAIVQEVVDRPDWISGHAIGLVLDGSLTTGQQRRCIDNVASGHPPRLTVLYVSKPGTNCTPCGHSSYGADASPEATLGLVGVGPASIGGVDTLRTTGLSASATTVWMFASSEAASLPMLDGVLLLDPTQILHSDVNVPQGGACDFAVPLPGSPSMVGASLRFQSLASDEEQPFGWAFSNGLTITLCP